MAARDRSYEEILADADQLFDQEDEEVPITQSDQQDRQAIRGHSLSITLNPPNNPFRKNSSRRLVLDVLSQGWIAIKDLKAILLSKNICRPDLVISQVTSLGTQEHYGYRIVESMGRYKAFVR